MDRQPPTALTDDIDLYIRTYYSLLRSTGEVKVRAFEEAHLFSNSSLHAGAREAAPDISAFGYSAARLPSCMPQVKRIVMAQSESQFENVGLDVSNWQVVTTRGRRRPLRWNGNNVLAAFITSATDIDDLVPIVTAYQIEWNKMHEIFNRSADKSADCLELSDDSLVNLRKVFGGPEDFDAGIATIAGQPCDLSMRLVTGTFIDYQRAAERWWNGIEPVYTEKKSIPKRRVYFVSSNTHSLTNLLGGYAKRNQSQIIDFARRNNPEGLAEDLDNALSTGANQEVSNLCYYLLRRYLHDGAHAAGRVTEVQQCDADSGITHIESPGRIDVSAQLIELKRLKVDNFDPRLSDLDDSVLAASDAVIINIDYPLGMAAYHHLSCLAKEVGQLGGVYVMGKAASLNARVGDIMIPTVAYDEHSQNTYLFRNCFSSGDIQPFVRAATVLDGQKALTVRSAFLQNRDYMSVFYREGYTILEMEAGPYLSALYELVFPTRHPADQIVHLSNVVPFEFGVLHYASDTPYSRRQSLLSKSLSYFGIDSTYGCCVAIIRKIVEQEARLLQAS